MNSTQIAASLFDAFAGGDAGTVRKLCAPDFRISQNGGPEMDVEALLGFSAAVLKVVRGFRYEEAVRSATVTGFVEEHAVRGTLPDGSQLNLSVCVVADLKDGKITYAREYFDSKASAGLVTAMS
jgi:ketosteroid isomerase-like protein